FLLAGRGLAAAHAAGIVHRDFKPSNVSIGAAGVRVLDFGLAVAAADGADGDAPSGAIAVDLTATGAFVGTPPYISPEQLRGERATARSDQWSFCVALYRALYGRMPFAGATADALRAAVAQGAAFPPGPPRFLVALLRRGLALDPSDRYPSMNALLADLAR